MKTLREIDSTAIVRELSERAMFRPQSRALTPGRPRPVLTPLFTLRPPEPKPIAPMPEQVRALLELFAKTHVDFSRSEFEALLKSVGMAKERSTVSKYFQIAALEGWLKSSGRNRAARWSVVKKEAA